MAAAEDLLTLDEAKQALNIPLADDTFDDELAMYVTAVSQRLDDECGPIVKREVTETHDGGGTVAFLRQPPVAAIESLTEYRSGVAVALAGETSTVTSGDDWYLDAGGVVRRRAHGGDSRFHPGRGNITVVYTAGRFDSTAAVSPKFKQAAAKMLAWLWKGDQGIGSATFGGGEETSLFGLGFALPNVVREMLAGEMQAPSIA